MNIELSLELMLLVFCLFLLCIVLLNQWLYKPILNFIDARDKMIKDDLESSSNNDSEIVKIQNKINNILEDAKKEAMLIKEQAQLQSKADYDKKIDDVKANNEKELMSFVESLNKEKDILKQELLYKMPEFKDVLNSKLKQMQL